VRVALLYEHPTWSIALVARMREREIDVTPIDVGALSGSRVAIDGHYDIWANRVNTMPSAGRPHSVVAATAHLLLSLEARGERVFNGARTYALGGSKAAQAELFAHLGLHTPSTIPVQQTDDLRAAADLLGFPILSKPNIGGSGTGIVRYDTAEQLDSSIRSGQVDLGTDGTGVGQRVINSADGFVHRIEMLHGELLYATRQPIQEGAFNYCAADGCAIDGGADSIEIVEPATELVGQAAEIMRAASADVGSVEYLVDADGGGPCFYDFNPYSNFITDHDHKLGFDPIDRYIDALMSTGHSPNWPL